MHCRSHYKLNFGHTVNVLIFMVSDIHILKMINKDVAQHNKATFFLLCAIIVSEIQWNIFYYLSSYAKSLLCMFIISQLHLYPASLTNAVNLRTLLLPGTISKELSDLVLWLDYDLIWLDYSLSINGCLCSTQKVIIH